MSEPITVPTESRDVEVSSRQQAIRMICATAYALQLTIEELREHDEIQRLAQHYGINTDDIRTRANLDREAAECHGYVNVYEFKIGGESE
ncbi:hypothetical protein [Sporosarcina sp. ITBMC105]